jgi:two-component system, chemotaxis family, protein-glutamate methylesterase/glutaminase
MSYNGKIRALIVDDSAIVRRALTQILGQDPEIEVVGTACDPYVARDMILRLRPDVLTLDIEMPRMDGLTFLRVLQQHHPLPVVIISSLTQAGSHTAMEALEAGAVDVIAKPGSAWSLGDLREQLAHRIKGAARARLKNVLAPLPVESAQTCVNTAGFHPQQLVVMGASTGGTEALKRVLTRLPDKLPPICIVQHIPPLFSKTFANRLNDCCAFEVREAAQGDELRPGLALVAPGNYHMAVCFEGARYRVRLDQGPLQHHTRPAVDVLFESAAACAAHSIVSVLLTGMGSDGAKGMQLLKARGARTIAQDEATSVVYGMPRAAAELGVVDEQLPLDSIPQAMLHAVQDPVKTSSHQTASSI